MMKLRGFAFFLAFTILIPARANVMSAQLEKSFRDDARIKVKKAVEIYNRARKAYDEKGPKAFVEALPDGISATDSAFVIRKLGSLEALPKIKLKDDRLLFFDGENLFAEMDVLRVAQGILDFSDTHFRGDFSKGIQFNFEKLKGFKKSSAFINFLNQLFLPQAEAKITGMNILAGLVIGVITYMLIPKASQYENAAPEVGAASPNGLGGDGAPAGAHTPGGGGGAAPNGGPGGANPAPGAPGAGQPGSGATWEAPKFPTEFPETASKEDIEFANRSAQFEYSQKPGEIVDWGKGEAFPSLGIGHYIWLPPGVTSRYKESFPDFVKFMASGCSDITDVPTEMKSEDSPWKTPAEFLEEKNKSKTEDNRYRKLVNFLNRPDVVLCQVKYQKQRKADAIAKIKELLGGKDPVTGDILSEDKRKKIASIIKELEASKLGQFALMDYINFKGEGLTASESYEMPAVPPATTGTKKGWGLLQVLEHAADSYQDGKTNEENLTLFQKSAAAVLAQRANNDPGDPPNPTKPKPFLANLGGVTKRVNHYSTKTDNANYSELDKPKSAP